MVNDVANAKLVVAQKSLSDGAYKVYVPVDREGATDVKFEFYYSKGGYNVFNSKFERRGWYLLVLPVTRSGNFEQFGMFSGGKIFMSPDEIKRNSKKAEQEARENITLETLTNVAKELI